MKKTIKTFPPPRRSSPFNLASLPSLATLGVATLALLFSTLAVTPFALAHPEARNVHELVWKKAHFAHIYAVGYTELGTGANQSDAHVQQIGDRSCIVGNGIGFDVEDTYAFDIDEEVTLTITYVPDMTSDPMNVVWDQNGGLGHGLIPVKIEDGEPVRTVTLKLPRARFSGEGTRNIDLAISASRKGQIAICDVKLERSGTTVRPTQFGKVKLTLTDAATKIPIPARVGIYDQTGRSPLPSEDALLVQRFGDEVRLLGVEERAFWPSANRTAFYALGSYEAPLPVGKYEICIARGPEYRTYHGSFEVTAGQTTPVTVALQRFIDMPANGWISSDDHIHLQREEVADSKVWWQTAAEDVHVANLLQMGNISGIYFDQPAWGEEGRYTHEDHSLVSGQEDPRTGQLGHTIHENLKKPFHLASDNYFLYHNVFEESHKEGGLSGFAHLGDWFHAQRGLAINVPFGNVDFIEVCEAGVIATDTWYGLLNMGYKILPSAGSDFPYTDLPGVSRLYVKVGNQTGLDAFYEAWRAGHDFVTNGPLLEFKVNGQEMGSEIHVKRGAQIEIAAEAKLNPDVDTLNRIELVKQGDVIATQAAAPGKDHVVMKQTITADHSMWLAVRAFGDRSAPRNTTEAHTAATYVIVDDEPFWKVSALPALVAHQHDVLQDILTGPLLPDEDLEDYETHDLLIAEWPKQRELLKDRIAQSAALYDQLLIKAGLPVPPKPADPH